MGATGVSHGSMLAATVPGAPPPAVYTWVAPIVCVASAALSQREVLSRTPVYLGHRHPDLL